jgi:hypothetical protein
MHVSEVLERGDIFFLYRPRVAVREVRSLDDVQRFFVVLRPDGRTVLRRLIVGRKRLPSVESHEREWAFVADVAEEPDERFQAEVRPAGEGRYAIVDHDGHTHLGHRLELPRRRGQAQRWLGIEREASYIVAVRNPDVDTPRGVGLPPERRADFPGSLMERFRGRRFAPLNPPSFLDYEGAEIVLIGASDAASRELGIDFDAEAERIEDADILTELQLRPGDVPLERLERGRWR